MATNLNPSKYGMVPKYLFDAMYSAPTAASGSNPFITQADLDAAVGLNNELSEVLANGNTTGGTDIAVSTGDKISGVAELTLDAVTTVDMTAGTDLTLTATAGFAYLYAPSGIAYVEGDQGFDLRSSGLGTIGVINAPTIDMTVDTFNVISATLVNIAATDFNWTDGTAEMLLSATGISLSLDNGTAQFFLLDATEAAMRHDLRVNITGPLTTITANDIAILSGTPTGTVAANSFNMYSADVVAGNAAPHFKTEAGNIIKLYSETTAIVGAAFTANSSGIADDTATWGGYTVGKVVAALKAQGLLT